MTVDKVVYETVLNNDKINDEQYIPKTNGYGVRHKQAILIFLCLTANCIDRGHVGVTIVAMTTNQKEIISNSSFMIDLINEQIIANTTNHAKGRYKHFMTSEFINITQTNTSQVTKYENTFNWTKSTQETILGFFYVGNCVTMLPIGLVSHRWGGKVPLQITHFINGLVSIATPSLSYWGDWKAACFCRFVQGLNQVTIFPSMHTLIAKWVPTSELGKLASFIYTGIPLGNIIGPQLSGFLADSRWGWPATYWAVGMINIICFLLLTAFGSETPLQHSAIKKEEKNFILQTTKIENFQKLKIPWKAILTSKPTWGTIVAHVGNCICFVFFFTEVPSYIYYIYGKDIKSSGLLSSLPYVGSIFTSIMFGWLSDYVTNNNIVDRKNARRIFNSISHCGLTFALLCVSFTDNIKLAIICLIIAMCVEVGTHAGWMLNYIDLAPNFSGTLMIIGGAFMNFFLVLLPVVVSFVVTDTTNIIQWRIMLFIIAAVSFISNLIFVLLISAETQSWNYVDNNEGFEGNKAEEIQEKVVLRTSECNDII